MKLSVHLPNAISLKTYEQTTSYPFSLQVYRVFFNLIDTLNTFLLCSYKIVLDETVDEINEEKQVLKELWPVSERTRFQHQTLNMTKFKLPNCYGFTIDNKLKNISASLDNNDYKAFVES